MEKELIIRSTPAGAEIALLEDGRLVELHREQEDQQFNAGDIYLGKVKRINPGLNAAFIDVGYKKDAFLHYTDLSPNIKSLVKYTNMARNGDAQHSRLDKFAYEPEIVKTGKINNALSKKHPMLVQIMKEPISTKGPRLTCEISIAGRFLILSPFTKTIGVSRKIASADERKRLVRLIESIKPANFGVVIRTVAQKKGVAELHEDLENLLRKWESITDKLKGADPPMKILGEINKTTGLLRDILSDDFSKIVINEKQLLQDIQGYIERIAPDKAKIVQGYSARRPIFDTYNVTRQIKGLFGKTVTMPSGAYLVIEHTEACHVIDVNSGQRTNNNQDQETNALNVNLEAAAEVARQLRLRDIGGIIVIDFIDMRSPSNKKKLQQVMRDHMKHDRAKHTVIGLSKFGLMQITRQRARPEITIATAEVCPACNGTGTIEASITIIDQIEHQLDHLIEKQNQKGLKLHVHPFVYAYLKSGVVSKRMQWYQKYNRWIKLFRNNEYHLTEFHFFDKNDEEIAFE